MKRFLILLGLIFVGGLFIGKNFASANYSQIFTNGYFHLHTPGSPSSGIDFQVSGGANSTIAGGTNTVNLGFYSTSTTLSITAINDVHLSIKNASGDTSNQGISVICTDGTGTHNGNSDNFNFSFISATSFQDVDFHFSSAVPCNSATLTSLVIVPSGWYGGNDFQFEAINNNTDGFNVAYVANTNTPLPTYNLKISINSGFPTTPTINFSSPPFNDQMTTPDFTAWDTCLQIPAGNPQTGYNVKIYMGTSSPDTLSGDLASSLGIPYVPVGTSERTGSCVLPTKLASSTAGTYLAIAALYDQSGATISTSSLLTLTITNGDTVSFPSQQASTIGAQTCPATNLVVLGVDWGNGLCKVAIYLIAPPQFVTNWFSDLKTSFEQKIPFSYFFEVQNDWSTAVQSPTTTLPSITMTIASSTASSLAGSQIALFSSSTISSVSGGSSPAGNSFATLRLLASYALWAGFATECVWVAAMLIK